MQTLLVTYSPGTRRIEAGTWRTICLSISVHGYREEVGVQKRLTLYERKPAMILWEESLDMRQAISGCPHPESLREAQQVEGEAGVKSPPAPVPPPPCRCQVRRIFY